GSLGGFFLGLLGRGLGFRQRLGRGVGRFLGCGRLLFGLGEFLLQFGDLFLGRCDRRLPLFVLRLVLQSCFGLGERFAGGRQVILDVRGSLGGRSQLIGSLLGLGLDLASHVGLGAL